MWYDSTEAAGISLRRKGETFFMHTDVLIVGGGPAGCAAALTLRSRNKTVVLCDSGASALLRAHRVDNYPGMPEASGADMAAAFQRQAAAAGAQFIPHPVRQLLPMGASFSALVGEDILTADRVILAVGVPRRASLPGESEGVGRGVSYCATCDGMFYRGRQVAVLGGFEEAVGEANFLATLAEKVRYLPTAPHDTSGLSDKITLLTGRARAVVLTDGHVTRLQVDDTVYPADGVFILRPASPPDQLLPGLKMEGSRIWTDSRLQTSVPGVYAAGDAAGAPYQVSHAVGQGCLAALSLCEDLPGK